MRHKHTTIFQKTSIIDNTGQKGGVIFNILQINKLSLCL